MSWILNHRKLMFFIFIVLLLIILLPRVKNLTVQDILDYTPESIPLAALAFLGFYVIKSLTMFFPVLVLYIAAGLIFPTGWAIFITIVCLTVSLYIGYFNGRWLGEERVEKLLAEKPYVSEFLESRKEHLPSLCFIARVSPLPFDLLSMFFGAVGMPYWQHILISLLGLCPIMIPYVIAGTSIQNPLSVEFLLPFGICLVVTVSIFIVFRKRVRRKQVDN